MLSRLIIIALVLCVPLGVAVVAQHLTRTVSDPPLKGDVLHVKLLKSGKRNAEPEVGRDAEEIPLSYKARSIKNLEPEDNIVVYPDAAGNAGKTSERKAGMPSEKDKQ
ncbi:hypothetical protein [Neisseria sp. CCUG12390]|uniref:hypothetical protein n=1 Tax=Neisseria sp. CCUG12390 TaxID=3392035 RepID=UPI003A10042A